MVRFGSVYVSTQMQRNRCTRTHADKQMQLRHNPPTSAYETMPTKLCKRTNWKLQRQTKHWSIIGRTRSRTGCSHTKSSARLVELGAHRWIIAVKNTWNMVGIETSRWTMKTAIRNDMRLYVACCYFVWRHATIRRVRKKHATIRRMSLNNMAACDYTSHVVSD